MKQQPVKKKMPFTREDYYKQLDNILGIPGQAPVPGGSLLGRIRQAVSKRKPQIRGKGG